MDYSKIFIKASKNNNGLVPYDELKNLLAKCNIDCSDAELQDYVNDIDININENGEINEDGFLNIISKYNEEKGSEEDISEIFEIFDKNGQNKLSPEDVLNVFSKIDVNISKEEILQLFEECDLDHDGYLNKEEFSRMINNHE